MDRGLISLKFAMLRNSSGGMRKAGWVIGALLVAATWAVAALAADDGVRHSALTLVFLVWAVGAMVGPVIMSGAGVLRPDYFALLPISRAALGRGLLMSVFVGVAAAYVLAALLAGTWHAVALSPPTAVLAVIGAALTWIFVITLSRLTYGALGAAMRSKLGIEIAGVQFGIMFAAMFAGWIVVAVAVQSIPALLSEGLPAGPITRVLDAAPTSWALLAVEAGASGRAGVATAWLLALAALDVVMVLATVRLLVPRSQRVSPRRGRPRSIGLVAGGGLLPATPTGAVIGKEVRQWRRDPWRALESSTGVWSGAIIGLFALLGGYTAPVAAFSGVIVALMLGLAGCNLYGQDGSAVWQNVVGESSDSVRADVRGRQWAMVVIFLPRAILVSAVFLLLGGAWWAAPYVIALIPAAIGAAAGAAVLVSAVGVSPGVDPRRRVGPNDANGNIALHVWASMIMMAIGLLPTAAMIAWAAVSGSPWVTAATAVVGVLNGFAAAWLFGRIAIGYLRGRMVDVFSRIRYGRIFRDSGTGVLDWLETHTLAGEVQLQKQKQDERDRKLGHSNVGG
ncbi:hypothetical protein [Occultella kanbiaonis]|uniref:hypothetical protein n=1 Tax=Occultella kanbiaonis TaxID=2675754 RepID=UPI0012B9FF96|nr:hypothetical protein [Occultella kanbiaonis]